MNPTPGDSTFWPRIWRDVAARIEARKEGVASTPWDRVSLYAEGIELPPGASGHGAIGQALAAHHPPGYARCYAVWWADADIENGGFQQFFYNSTGDLVFLAVECYEHVGQHTMAAIFKSAVTVCRKQYREFIRYSIPEGYFDGFTPLADDLHALDAMYGEEKSKLPGMAENDGGSYLDGFISDYWQVHPEEFSQGESTL